MTIMDVSNVITLLVVAIHHRGYGLTCSVPIVQWLIVDAGYFFFSAIKSIILIRTLQSERFERIKRVTNTVFFWTFFIFKIAWLIYGNTFIYS